VTRAVIVALIALATLVSGPPSASSAAPVNEDQVREIGAELRCVVCQNLSVADSPSETAHQMREIIRERLASGESAEQIKAYFVEKYGLWILLAPPRRGFNLVVWVVPFAGLAVGLVLVAFVIRRWRRQTVAADAAQAPALDETMRQRIRREMAELDR
jgi:cytochrome c-type biogenesis protein CcmH